MIVVDSIEGVRKQVAERRARLESVALVPTMGNLHEGHRTLIRSARSENDVVVVSLYVNPFQFGPTEDLATYPRTEEQDRKALLDDGVDVLFMPDDKVMYPRGLEQQTRVEVPQLGSILEGETRPVFFRGVTTVVNRLFNITRPDVAYFGKKDFQQLTIIKRMVDDLAMPVEIIGVDTVRDPDGLALSSRNGYLSESERRVAPALYRGMRGGIEQIQSGGGTFEDAEQTVLDEWVRAGVRPDYASVRRRGDLAAPGDVDRELVILGAGYVGSTRLIDNLEFDVPAVSRTSS
jgi:pantoate--beta-alanine ligase